MLIVERRTLRWAWQGSLAFFVLAGLTGSFYRFILANGWNTGMELTNIRHAHSHVMYFGWATPALFALIARDVLTRTGQAIPQSLKWILIGSFAAALSAYPLFMAFGYSSVQIGDARMPIAVLSSTLNMVAWYAFVIFYVRRTRGLERDRALQLWDIALVFLVLATLGAASLSLTKPLGIENPSVSSALTHVFLDFFSEGWFVLGVLGLAAATLTPSRRDYPKWSTYFLCAGLPLTFALGMPSILVPPPLKIVAGIGGSLVGIGLLGITVDVFRGGVRERLSWMWYVPFGFLALKALGQVVISAFPTLDYSSMHGLRVLYLHTMLLGFVSLGLAAAARHAWESRRGGALSAFYVSVALVLISLLMLTPIFPVPWSVYETAAWVSLLPVGAAVWMGFESALHG